jgi:hypothetical protein
MDCLATTAGCRSGSWSTQVPSAGRVVAADATASVVRGSAMG